ncbi:MAG: hypothetical protein ABI855_18165, partial [Bacteroidota bacterium]
MKKNNYSINASRYIGMKIKSLLCVLALWLICGSVNAQVIQVGTGTVAPSVGSNPSSGANGASPYGVAVGSGTGGKRVQILYTAAQINAALAAASLTTGVPYVISTTSWDISSAVGSNASRNQIGTTIKMANTAAASLAFASPITGLTTVFGPTAVTFPTSGTGYLVTNTLATNFTWDGTSNLVVEYCYTHSNVGLITTYGGCRRTNVGVVQMIYNGGGAVNCGSAFVTNVQAIPNVKFTVASACTQPTTLASAMNFSSLTTSSVQVNWTNGNGASRVVVAHATTAVSAGPATGTDYSAGANSDFTLGQNLGSGNIVVYAGTGSSVNVTGLTGGQTYFFSVYEASATFCFTAGFSGSQAIPTCFPPTLAASGINFSNVLTTSNDVNWTRGDGDAGVIVFARLSTSTNTAPTNGTAYTANAAFGSGTQIGTGNFAVYQGAGTTVNVTNLLPSTNYVYSVYEYNATGLCYGSPGSGNQTSASCSPSVQPSSLTVPCVDYTTMTLSFNRGNGTHTIILAKATSAVNADPAYNTSYTANTAFGSGSQIGTGNYVVYNGNDPGTVSVSLTNLTPTYTVNGAAVDN